MNIKFSPNILHLIVSTKCNIKCRHCHQNANGENELILTEEELSPVIIEAGKLGIRRIVIMGGEIFLFPELVNALIKISHDNSLNVSFATNGYWGKSLEAAESVMDLLENAGWYQHENSFCCDDILISAGEFHQEWLSSSTIKTAISAYHSRFKKPIYIDFEYTEGKRNLVEQFIENMSSLPEKSYIISQIRTNFYKFGRTIPLSDTEMHSKHYIDFSPCPWIDRIVIHSNGEIYPCCGYNDNNPGLCIGNMHLGNISDIISAANKSFIIKLLLNIPMGLTYGILKKRHPDLPTFFSNHCELCEIICKPEYRIELENEFRSNLSGIVE